MYNNHKASLSQRPPAQKAGCPVTPQLFCLHTNVFLQTLKSIASNNYCLFHNPFSPLCVCVFMCTCVLFVNKKETSNIQIQNKANYKQGSFKPTCISYDRNIQY